MDTMDPDKKSGILMIIIGICIPLAVLPFVSGFSKNKSFYENLYKSGIELRKDTAGETGKGLETASNRTGTLRKMVPHGIPFRIFLVATAILSYIGIIRIDRARRRKRGDYDSPDLHGDDLPPPSSNP
jgi:hypothetical protein